MIDPRRDCRVKTEPAKRVSPITLQALIPTTRRLAWLRLAQAYSKPRPQPTRAMSAAVGVLARQRAVKTAKRQLQARGLKLQSGSHGEIIALADKYLADVSRRRQPRYRRKSTRQLCFSSSRGLVSSVGGWASARCALRSAVRASFFRFFSSLRARAALARSARSRL